MQISIHSKNLELQKGQKEFIESKVNQLKELTQDYSDSSSKINIEVNKSSGKTTSKNTTLEITMFIPNATIRGEVKAENIENAAELLVNKLKTQIEQYKDKRDRRSKDGKLLPESTFDIVTEAAHQEKPKSRIVKRKRFSKVIPLKEEEAIEHMELIGHNFYLFLNANTDRYSVIYKREDGNYGLIEPKLE